MDDIINYFPKVEFGELNWCHENGVMYQRDTTTPVEYGDDYFQHYVELEDSAVAVKLNAGRVAMSHRHCKTILDMGIGSGEFIKKSTAKMYGYDINPKGIAWLQERNLWADPYKSIPEDVEGITLWDTLEHIAKPSDLLRHQKPGMFVFVSLPIFHDLTKVRFSKHYKKNEHFSYWTATGLIAYFEAMHYECIEVSDHEMLAGRQDILAFAFRKK